MLGGRKARLLENARQQASMVQPYDEILKPQPRHHFADGAEKLRLDDERRRANRIDIALEELAEAPPRGSIGAPDGLNLIPLEELRQLVLVLGDDARERNRQVVAQREIRLAARFVLAALQNRRMVIFLLLRCGWSC